jgi:carbamoyltransferase
MKNLPSTSSRAKPWILGIASSHNGGACLLRGDEIVVAIQEERLTREKRAEHRAAHDTLAVRYCLEYAGISPRHLNAISVCCSRSMDHPEEDVNINPLLHVQKNKIPVYYVPHHLGHAWGTFSTSGLSDAAVLVIDGRGSPWEDISNEEQKVSAIARCSAMAAVEETALREIVSLYYANEFEITPVHKIMSSLPEWDVAANKGMPLFASLGDMYGAVGYQIFGSFFDGPGKVMGLAPYGHATIPAHEFCEYHNGHIVFRSVVPERFNHDIRWPHRQADYKDLAASTQNALEVCLHQLLHLASSRQLSDNLCYAGGVALNSVANEAMMAEGLFSEHFIMPASEDSGTAIGAAFYGLWRTCGKVASARRMTVDSVGRGYSPDEIAAAVEQTPLLLSKDVDDVANYTATKLSEGKIVGWFQGGSELGPRALGSRSILCDPRVPTMKEKLNKKVKFREAFRPFAPVILEDDVQEWFDISGTSKSSPFMLRIMPFKYHKRDLVPAVVHIDGTGRVQTINQDSPLLLKSVLGAFKTLTSIPLLLNTSFNVAGEPIVETPSDAVWCFLISGMDLCVLGNRVLEKPADFDVMTLIPVVDTARIHLMFNRVQGSWQFLDRAGQLLTESIREEALGSQVPIVATPYTHVGVLDEVTWRLNKSHLRIVVYRQGIDVAYSCPLSMLSILMRIDGRLTLKDLYRGFQGTDGSSCKAEVFLAAISYLRRIGAISFRVDEETRAKGTH